MRELSFMGPSNDGQRLLLVAEDGTEFELVVDSRLVAVITREHGPSPRRQAAATRSAPLPTPREIQDRVRHGEAVAAIAAEADVDEEQIARFAYPVITEREHVCQQAREAQVSVGADRSSLEDAVSERVRIRAVDPSSIRWDAWRRTDDKWTVVAAYPAAQGDRVATFTYSQVDHSVVPADDEGSWLLEQGAGTANPTPTTPPPTDSSPDDNERHGAPIQEHPIKKSSDTRPTTEAKAHRGWDQAHPAARAAQRRETAVESSHPAGSASRRAEKADAAGATSRDDAKDEADADAQDTAPAAQPAAPASPPPTPPNNTPHWEELLFGSPRDEE